MLKDFLPDHPAKTYDAVGRCIYCGSTNNLSDEHIIPFAFGGRMVLPKSSCNICAGLSSAFEHTCLRTMFGPLRMLYDLPSRRKKKRPATLPLKVKHKPGDNWTEVPVRREDYPFLVMFPYFLMPDLLSGHKTLGNRGAVTERLWIRGASASHGFFDHMDDLIAELGVHSVMPEAKAHVKEFCLMLAKIAHSYAVAELGNQKFKPLLLELILQKNLSNRADFIGGLDYDEPPSGNLHELSIEKHPCNRSDLVVVRIRFLSKLATPTYYVVVGHHLQC
ncbi:MAG: HNH endonuclease [Thermodesulfovibrionales bacterium]